MTLKQYLTLMIISTSLCFLAWGLTIINVDPTMTDGVGFSFFYASFFLSLLGTLSLFLFWMYSIFPQHSGIPLFRIVKRSFRDAGITSICVLSLLILQGLRLIFLPLVFFIALLFAAIGGLTVLHLYETNATVHKNA